MASKKFRYFPLRADKTEDDFPLDDRSDRSDDCMSDSARIKPRMRRKTTVILTTTLGTCFLLLTHFLTFWLGTWWRPSLARQCLEYTSMWSPVLEHMNPEYHMVQFNGTLGHKTEYTGDPSPEVDAAWEKWAYVHYASLPEETMKKLPESMDSARLTPEYGGGYIGFLEVSHHIHCLNVLRKAVYADYYTSTNPPDPLFGDKPFVVEMHIKHCIETLRQNIMCNADASIITHHWVLHDPDPFANFNTWHKCRDIGAVENWIRENRIPDTPVNANGSGRMALPRPEGDRVWARPP